MLHTTVIMLSVLAIMLITSTLISRKILNYIVPKWNLEKQTQKEIKCLVSSIITILTGWFVALYLLLFL